VKLTAFIAGRYLRSGRKSLRHSAIMAVTGAGIVLASFLVLLSLAILAGSHRTYRRAILDFNAHLIIAGPGLIGTEGQEELEGFLKDLSGRRIPLAYSPYVSHTTLMPTVKGMKTVIFKGIALERLSQVYPLNLAALPDTSHSTSDGVYVGKAIIALQPQIGTIGRIKILRLDGEEAGGGSRYETLPVVGSFTSGVHDFDAQFILMDYRALQRRFDKGDGVSGYEIRLDDIDRVNELVGLIAARFQDRYDLRRWDELNAELLEILHKERFTTFVVAVLVLLIACLNIMGFNFLFFMEREREFRILNVLGAGLRRLRGVLTVLSLATGGVATLIGAGLSYAAMTYLERGPGIPLDPEVYFVDKIPVYFEPTWFVAFVVGTVFLCLVTGLTSGWVILRRRDV
jgi:lipoprotein-releasing system permease protein